MMRPAEVEQGEVEHRVPGKGVANLAVERVGLVLVEAEDIGPRLDAGHLPAQPGDAGADQHGRKPCGVSPTKTVGEETECQGAGCEKENPDPDRPVRRPVDARVACADLPGFGVFHLAAVSHVRSFAEWAGVSQCFEPVSARVRERRAEKSPPSWRDEPQRRWGTCNCGRVWQGKDTR